MVRRTSTSRCLHHLHFGAHQRFLPQEAPLHFASTYDTDDDTSSAGTGAAPVFFSGLDDPEDCFSRPAFAYDPDEELARAWHRAPEQHTAAPSSLAVASELDEQPAEPPAALTERSHRPAEQPAAPSSLAAASELTRQHAETEPPASLAERSRRPAEHHAAPGSLAVASELDEQPAEGAAVLAERSHRPAEHLAALSSLPALSEPHWLATEPLALSTLAEQPDSAVSGQQADTDEHAAQTASPASTGGSPAAEQPSSPAAEQADAPSFSQPAAAAQQAASQSSEPGTHLRNVQLTCATLCSPPPPDPGALCIVAPTAARLSSL